MQENQNGYLVYHIMICLWIRLSTKFSLDDLDKNDVIIFILVHLKKYKYN